MRPVELIHSAGSRLFPGEIMALFKSQLATSVSGSVGGTTYAHNKSGMYMRARSIPVQPNSAAQLAVRSALTALVNAWKNTLTAAERAAWELYAQNVSITNPLGDQINNSGQNWYIGANTPRLQANTKLTAGLSRVDAGPTTFDRGEFTTPTAPYGEAGGLLVSGFAGDAFAAEDGAAMFVYQGAPQDSSVNFFKGPFRLVGIGLGDSGTPITTITISAATLTSLGYTVTQGQNVWTAVAVSRADGRLSTRRIIGPSAVGA